MEMLTTSSLSNQSWINNEHAKGVRVCSKFKYYYYYYFIVVVATVTVNSNVVDTFVKYCCKSDYIECSYYSKIKKYSSLISFFLSFLLSSTLLYFY